MIPVNLLARAVVLCAGLTGPVLAQEAASAPSDGPRLRVAAAEPPRSRDALFGDTAAPEPQSKDALFGGASAGEPCRGRASRHATRPTNARSRVCRSAPGGGVTSGP